MDTRTLRTGSEIFNKDKHWMKNFTSNSVNIFDQISKYEENKEQKRISINESDGIANSLIDGLQNIYIHGPQYKYPYSVNDPVSYPYQYRKKLSSSYRKRPACSTVLFCKRQNPVVEPQNDSFSDDSEDLDYLEIGPIAADGEKSPAQDLLKFADTTTSTMVSFSSQALNFQKKMTDLKTNLEEVLALLSGMIKVVDDKVLADYEEKVKKVAFLFDKN